MLCRTPFLSVCGEWVKQIIACLLHSASIPKYGSFEQQARTTDIVINVFYANYQK
jgi:hypothetical protein